MSVDGWIRRAALLAIPLLAGVLFFARSRGPAAEPPGLEGAPSSGPSTPDREHGSASGRGMSAEPGRTSWAERSAVSTEEGSLGQALAERGEAALGAKRGEEPPKPTQPEAKAPSETGPLPVATSAAELPLAGTAPHRSTTPSVRRERSSPAASACGGVEVKLITASDDPAWAFASLTPGLGEQAVLRRRGERVGNWQVDQIEWDRVWLRAGGARCMVGMHFGAREAEQAVPGARRSGLPTVRPEQKPWRVPGEIANAIDKLGQTEFSVEKAMVPAIFDQAGALLSGLHIEPVKRGEEIVGFELGEVQTDSLLERLGVETGDVVLAVDGEPVQSLEALARSLDGARSRDRLVARLERNGEAFELRVVAR